MVRCLRNELVEAIDSNQWKLKKKKNKKKAYVYYYPYFTNKLLNILQLSFYINSINYRSSAVFLLGLLFNPEDGGDVLLRNVVRLSMDHMALYSRSHNPLKPKSYHLLNTTETIWRYCVIQFIRHIYMMSATQLIYKVAWIRDMSMNIVNYISVNSVKYKLLLPLNSKYFH
jgi:hypothetical protein